VYKDPKELPEPEALVDLLETKNPKKKKTLVVIDDCMNKHQKTLQSYFIYGRPLGINTIYLTQAYYSVDKDTIRNNCQLTIAFELLCTDLRNSYEQLGEKTFGTLGEYKSYAKKAWEEVQDKDRRNRGYFVVDVTSPAAERFRKNCF
jgi:hypothetical protein